MNAVTLTLLATLASACDPYDPICPALLHQAAQHGDLPRIQELLTDTPEPAFLLKTTDEHGQTALHLAACYGHNDVVQQLLSLEVHAETITAINGETPLMCAAWNKHNAVVEALINYGVNLDQTDYEGRTALYYATCQGYAPAVTTLLQAGAQPEAATIYGETPLICAAWNGHVALIDMLIGYGVNPQQTYAGQTALYYAACQGHSEAVSHLLEMRAQTNIMSNESLYALECAIYKGYTAIQALLLSKLNANHRNTVIHHALTNNDLSCLRVALDGLESLSFSTTFRTWLARFYKSDELLKLVESNEIVRNRSEFIDAACAVAAASLLYLSFRKTFLEHRDCCLMRYAAEQGHPNLARSLIAYGASVDGTGDIEDANNRPLLLALHNGNAAVAKVLLERGASVVRYRDTLLDSPLLLALHMFGNHSELIPLIVDCIPRTALFRYLRYGHLIDTRWVKPLLEMGALLYCAVGQRHFYNYHPDLLEELAQRGELRELVHPTRSRRSKENRAIIEQCYDRQLVVKLRQHVTKRDRAVHALIPAYLGNDIEQLICSF